MSLNERYPIKCEALIKRAIIDGYPQNQKTY